MSKIVDTVKSYLLKLFSENSEVSMMRVMSLLSLTVGSILAFVGLNKKNDPTSLAVLVGVFVGSAFGGKVMQKAQEIKETAKSDDPDAK